MLKRGDMDDEKQTGDETMNDFISASDDQPTPRKMVVYGPEGIGKTTFAASCPLGPVVILPTERGYQDVRPKVAVWTVRPKRVIETEAELIQGIGWLLREDHPFKCVVLDAVESVQQMVTERILSESGEVTLNKGKNSFGVGKALLIAGFAKIMSGLDALNQRRGMTVIYVGHSEVSRCTPPDADAYDRYTLRMQEDLAAMLKEDVDEIFFASSAVYTKTTDGAFGAKDTRAVGLGERVLHTSRSAFCDAKNRLGLPATMPMAWEHYAKAISDAGGSDLGNDLLGMFNATPAPAGNIAGIVRDGSSKTQTK